MTLLLLALLAGAAHPTVHLRLWPCRTDCILSPGSQVDARVIVRDPRGELRCPSIELETRRKTREGVEAPFPDHRSAVEVLTCGDPFGPRVAAEYRLQGRPLKFWAHGLHVVRVTVRGADGGRKYFATRDVFVGGGDEVR